MLFYILCKGVGTKVAFLAISLIALTPFGDDWNALENETKKNVIVTLRSAFSPHRALSGHFTDTHISLGTFQGDALHYTLSSRGQRRI